MMRFLIDHRFMSVIKYAVLGFEPTIVPPVGVRLALDTITTRESAVSPGLAGEPTDGIPQSV